jgi:FixJ family two-component response regulator
LDNSTPRISIVDDDAAVLKSIGRLLRSAGFEVRTFPSPHQFLAQPDRDAPGCIVIDLAMPGLNGLDLQQALLQEGCCVPVIFISGNACIPDSVRAMKLGAVDFLTKPFEQEDLLGAVRRALARDFRLRERRDAHAAILVRLEALTPREREVLEHLLKGKLNKQIAADLGTAEKTIKVHRARVLRKMGARSVAELVKLTLTAH